MLTTENTDGFSGDDLELLNAAVAVLVARGIDESNAGDIVNNNWQRSGNTVETLTRI